ncbi:transposase family protein [Staphylococcus schleiferi]|uniref:transposase family protein n=1 Tax=Staphylococcus schleiferi TaxID=1295 RepID=UPI0021D3A5F8|nr:transposase family protein [Staphylococcus schleiferi]UXR55468.1 transposase family protein [Staphylococcus schleiferi]UXR57774.1 transposase family protein [Staphylococcus schleiferi]UXR60061.1 transposase family protein [Staphylococcus schleiferi]UXR62377.1 transposase family protein [Staphylococcus schleiferi]
MCNDILKLLKIKDNNIKITKVEEDVVIRGKKSNVIFGTLSYKPMTCPHCYHTNPNRIHKHGKRLSRITFLRFQEIAVYLNLLKQRFKYMDGKCYASTESMRISLLIRLEPLNSIMVRLKELIKKLN